MYKYNVSGIQQSESYIYIYFSDLFHYRLLQDTEYCSLSYTVSPYYLSILYIIVCIC